MVGPAEDGLERSKPNIVLIRADDLEIGLLGCYGQEIILPRIMFCDFS